VKVLQNKGIAATVASRQLYYDMILFVNCSWVDTRWQ